MKIAIKNMIGIDRNKTTLACPELAEERSVRWRFRRNRSLPETPIFAVARKGLFRAT
ncbi:MAG: hypothetical protein ACXV8Q_02390 [Methylobacter sp.]